ncbi:MAG: hypothetical protein II661_06975 [Bacteroidales bacterium]|nr:hypothetical protein [Bacteroidales bacterium]
MTRAEEAALKAYPDNEVLFFAQDADGKNHPVTTFGREINGFIFGYEQAEKDLINRIRKQVETWMPERDGDEHTEGERLAFRSVLHLLEELEDKK